MEKKLIIFDLDGTLLNTIGDLAESCNYALSQYDFPLHTVEEYQSWVGNGISKLLERSLPEKNRDEETIGKIKKVFLEYYDVNNTVYTTPYPGINDLLEKLQQHNFLLGVASNKYQSATLKLVNFYFPHINFISVLGERENIPVKPDPAIVEDIISLAKVKREEVLYIGDSGVDIQTTKNAQVSSIAVTWGFREKKELETLQPDFIVDTPEEIISLVIVE